MRSEHIHRCGRNAISAGFTLVEIAVTILLLGLLFAIAVPTMQQLSGSYTLKASGENIAAQLRMARQKAISTGVDQPMHFTANFQNSDYHVHLLNGTIPAKWKLPKGITYFWGAGTLSAYTMQKDGRSNFAGLVILQDTRGVRDTVSVEASGLVLTQ